MNYTSMIVKQCMSGLPSFRGRQLFFRSCSRSFPIAILCVRGHREFELCGVWYTFWNSLRINLRIAGMGNGTLWSAIESTPCAQGGRQWSKPLPPLLLKLKSSGTLWVIVEKSVENHVTFWRGWAVRICFLKSTIFLQTHIIVCLPSLRRKKGG
jgi:hypothetical protein